MGGPVYEIENEVVNISLSGYNKYFTLGISYGSPVLGDHNTGILVLCTMSILCVSGRHFF